MNHFLAEHISKGEGILSSSDSHHALRVLRLKVGDHISVSHGDGKVYLAEISQENKKGLGFKILSLRRTQAKAYLHLAIAPTKSNDRFEMALEKVCEFGVASIRPIICEHSERKIYKLDRGERILEAAFKQSHKGFLPPLLPLQSFKDFVQSSDLPKQRYLAALSEGMQAGLKDLDFASELVVAIGPEGDFSPTEVQLALDNGFQLLNLGKEVLRTETAAISVAAIANFHQNQEE